VKITIANNYQLDVVERLYYERAWPGEHLWGMRHLEALGHEVTVTPWPWDVYGAPVGPLARHLPKRVREAIGPIAYQRAVMRQVASSDLLFSAHADTTQGLALLKSIGGIRKPLVGMPNPQYHHSRWAARAVGSFDAAICISERVARDIRELVGLPPNRVHVLGWGPDLAFPGYYAPPGGTGIISTGKARRDITTLLTAANNVPSVPFMVYGNAGDSEIGSHIKMRAATGYRDVLADMAAAAVVAIPLPLWHGEPTGTTGLTELNAAMAMGKPVIMTRNPFIDIDIAAEGIGLTVEPYDVAGWVRAFQQMSGDPAAAQEMGARGRTIAEQSWNSEQFGQGIASIFESL
jgi:glycosyltransferase involved in cell wall biosynthesis